MRLIDADKLIEEINNLGWRLYDTLTLKGLSIALETINQQPTAFDVDKVEKELEEKVENSNLNIQIICFSQALDIFKGGKNE